MSALANAVRISKAVNNVSKLFTNLTLSSNIVTASVPTSRLRITHYRSAFLHTTPRRNDLMEFFDDEKNWGEFQIKVGRSWKKDELRIKSNEDLHKLWFVLLKERNMLLTMEHACKEGYQLFPNPERKDKIDESMTNLEEVVRERNKAYHLLETGVDGERPGRLVHNQLGMEKMKRHDSYLIRRISHLWFIDLDQTYRGVSVSQNIKYLLNNSPEWALTLSIYLNSRGPFGRVIQQVLVILAQGNTPTSLVKIDELEVRYAPGMRYYYRMSEHRIPRILNKVWREKYKFGYGGHAVKKFLGLYREKIWDAKRRARNRDRNEVMHLMKRFPNMDMEALKEKYPNVDYEFVKNHKKSRGHFVPQ